MKTCIYLPRDILQKNFRLSLLFAFVTTIGHHAKVTSSMLKWSCGEACKPWILCNQAFYFLQEISQSWTKDLFIFHVGEDLLTMLVLIDGLCGTGETNGWWKLAQQQSGEERFWMGWLNTQGSTPELFRKCGFPWDVEDPAIQPCYLFLWWIFRMPLFCGFILSEFSIPFFFPVPIQVHSQHFHLCRAWCLLLSASL